MTILSIQFSLPGEKAWINRIEAGLKTKIKGGKKNFDIVIYETFHTFRVHLFNLKEERLSSEAK